jgi:hemerythrin-like domain-containing protein
MLGDCHRRINRFLHVLVALATQEKGGPLSEDERTQLSTSLRYFRDAAPTHTADEEQSLFPRLRRLASPDAEAVLARIQSLEHDHEAANRKHDEVDRLGQLWLCSGQLTSADASQLTALLLQLDAFYHEHIGKEDTEVFPFAARVLPPAEVQAIGREMAARRGVSAETL